MFTEYYEGITTDMTYCTNKSCPIRECARHPNHWPKGKRFISVAGFTPVCRTYMATVVSDADKIHK